MDTFKTIVAPCEGVFTEKRSKFIAMAFPVTTLDEIKEHLSTFLRELRESPKSEGAERIYTHGEKEILAYSDRLENGINVNINTVAEMKDLCDYLNMDSVKYLGDVDFSAAKQSSYK